MKRLGLLASLIICLFLMGTAWANNETVIQAGTCWKNNQTAKAVELLEGALDQEPENYELLWNLGKYYDVLAKETYGTKRAAYYEKGLRAAERAVKLNPEGPDGHLWYAVLLGESGMEKGGAQALAIVKPMHDELQTALRLDPGNAMAHYLLAQLFFKAPGKPVSIGDKKKALDEIKLAVKFDGENPGYWFSYGMIAADSNQSELYQKAIGKYLDLTDSYQYTELEKLEPDQANDYERQWRTAYYYQFLGDNGVKKQRLKYFEKGLRFADRAVKENGQGVEGHLWRGVLLGCIGLEKGVLKSLSIVKPMRDELETAIRIDSKNAMAHYTLSQLYWKVPGKPISIGDKKKALDEASLSIKYDPDNLMYLFNYGKIAVDYKDNATVKTVFKKILDMPGEYGYYKTEAQKELDKVTKQ